MAEYHVALTGNDSNNGNISSPWKTINKANQTLKAGDTVFLHAGEYQEIISPVNSGILGSPITYTAYTGEIPLIVGSGPDKPGVVSIGWVAQAGWDSSIPANQRTLMNKTSIGYESTPKNYITIDRLHISYKWSNDPTCVCLWGDPFYSPEGRFGYVHIDNHSSVGNVIKNCKIYQSGNTKDNYVSDFRQTGIMYAGSGAIFENNEIFGMWLGIWLCGQSKRNVILRKNIIHDVGSSGIDIGSPGTQEIQSTLIEENTIGPTVNEDGIQFEPWYDQSQIPYDQTSNRGVVIRKNIFRYCAENSIDLKGAGYILIEDNVAYGSPGQDDGGIKTDYRTGKYVSGSSQYAQTKDSNGNWILETAENRSGGQGFICLGAGNMAENVIIRNNIAYDNMATMQIYQRFKIYNNTFIGNNRDFTGPNSSYNPAQVGFLGLLGYGGKEPPLTTDIEGAVVKNNIIASHDQGEMAINVYGFTTNIDLDFNIFSNTKSGVRFRDPGGYEWAYYTFPQWKSRLNSSSVLGKEINSKEVSNIGFVNVPDRPVGEINLFDFNLTSTSPAKKAGTYLTKTLSAGSGTTVKVNDAYLFCDGNGIVTGDSILIGSNASVIITSVVDKQTLQINKSISWNLDDHVTLERIGFTPDAGAILSIVPPSGIPVISVQPITQTVVVGQSVTFSVAASGAQPLLYQWRKNGVNILNATSSIYTISTTISTDNNTEFSCLVSNSIGNVISNPAILTVNTITPTNNLIINPGFESGTNNWSFFSNAGSTFTVEPSGDTSPNAAVINIPTNISTTPPLNVQLNQVNFPLEKGVSYKFSFRGKVNVPRSVIVVIHKNTAPYDNYGLNQQFDLTTSWQTYSATFVSNITMTSDTRIRFWFAEFAQSGDKYYIDNVSLEKVATPVPIAPVFTVQPQSLIVSESQSASFSISATGTSIITYQWQKNEINLPGEFQTSYTIPVTTNSDNNSTFRCIATNSVGSTSSDVAILTVLPTQTDYQRGYADGFAAGKIAGYDNGYSDGKIIGYNNGYADGKIIGYENGYSEASASAVEKWKESSVIISSSLETLTVQAGVQFSIIKGQLI